MTFARTKALALLALAAPFLMAAPEAEAHPHIFAEARLEVDTSADGTITELRNVWRFDEVFSSSVIMDFDTNRNMKLDPDELANVGGVVRDSLAEFNYFVSLVDNGKDIAITAPEHMVADYQDGLLLLIFAVKPANPLQLKGKVSVGIYDPTMYTAIDFPQDEDLVVTGAGAESCSRKVVRPDPDEVIAQNQGTLTEAFFNDPSGNDLTKLFATRIELECQ
jgi:ABC-type uncharacterized transport system, periplasmic component